MSVRSLPTVGATLRRLVSEREVDPKKVGINLPDALVLPDPYAANGKCDFSHELRLGLFLVKDRTAERVLDWPASTCAFGSAASVAMDEQDELTLGYTSGATVTFLWSKDHFERTEIGSR